MSLLRYPAPCPPRPTGVVGWNGSSPGCWLEQGDLRDRLESAPAGLLGHFRRRRLARQLAGLERARKSYGRLGHLFRMETNQPVPTRGQQAGLRLEDVPRPSLAQLIRRNRLDTKIRRALGLVLRRRRRPKN